MPARQAPLLQCIENLLPGALILAQLAAVVPKGIVGQYPEQFAWLMSQAVAGAVTFTAAAYLLSGTRRRCSYPPGSILKSPCTGQ